MYLSISPNKKTGRPYLSIVHKYVDPHTKRQRTKTIQKVGYLDELKKQYEDPIAHFKAVATQLTEEQKTAKEIVVRINMDERIELGSTNRKNYGHVVFSKIYHELEIDRFLKNARRHQNFEFNTDSIMRLLTFSRLLYPGSKRAAELGRERFFDNFRFSIDDIYNALTHFDTISDALQQHLHGKVSELYGRDTSLVYYDITNYYFEIDRQDDLRKRGAEKNKRNDPIVQMGLLLDKAGLPISYKLFPGNTHDSQTLMPVLTEAKKKFNARRIIVVADKGLNSGDNIVYNTILGDGYIYSKSIRGASDEFKKWVLDEEGYRQVSDKYKMKSKHVPDAEIRVTTDQPVKRKPKKPAGGTRKTPVRVEQKWIVYYSKKYADRSRYKREEAIAKALKMIANPAKYRKSFDYGAVGYIKNLTIDKETGELLNFNDELRLDQDKIAEEEKYDGYYAIITSELDDSDESIIEAYHGLWRIEESFKVTKSVLEARPVFLRLQEHINAHFLICFIALLISRIVELRLNRKYTIERIVETLRQVECSHEFQNYWLFNYIDEVTEDIKAAFDMDFSKKRMTLREIKQNLGSAKKR